MSTQEQLLDPLQVDHLHADLRGRSVRGGVLSLTSQGTQFLLQSVSTVVLARLLTPSDYGLVAMVTTVTAVAVGFADLGLTEATIQRKAITHAQVSTLFWINVGVGLLLTLITAAMAPVLAWFYREPRLVDLTLVMSLTFLLGGLRGQHTALLRRQMRFSALAIRDVTALAVSVPVAIVMASKGFGYWAIVAIPLVGSSVQVVLSWVMVKWRPSAPRRNAGVRSMVSFGGKVAASYMAINWIRTADNVLIGWYWGAAPLGLYSRAYNLLMLPVIQMNIPIGGVAIPALSRVHDDPELFARYYIRLMNLMMWVSGGIFGFLFAAATPVIILTLGHKWQGAAPVFQMLALSALGQVLLESIIWCFVSRGQSGQLLKLLLVISPIIIAGFCIGLPFGIKWVAASLSLVFVAILPWMLKYAFRGTNLTLGRVGRAFVCPLSLCLTGVLVAKLAARLIVPQGVLLQLLVVAVSFATVYSMSALIPAVRAEMFSFKKLFGELRLSRTA
ncbi:MAG TPA: lipopolysaccharide biosynthesis protein [Candidatus Limnocylindrales bacterium]|nr:lipopolysaccharide biosynthesis protein [Candidatus Limnocylindrales bacterium]